MKKIVLLSLFMVAMATAAFAQPRAIGGRIGYGFEASYQHSLSEQNMIQVDLGLPGFNSIEAVATYNWLNPGGHMIPWEYKGSWNWYAGVGAGGGFGWSYDALHPAHGFIGVAGMVGVEYNFWFPLQLSVDYRPMIGVDMWSNYYGFNADFYGPGLFSGAIAIGARYIF